jgi:hypothetical protein
MVGFQDSVYNPLTGPDFQVWYDTTRHYLTANPQLYFKMFTDGRFKRQNLSESKRDEQHKITLFFGAPYPEVLDLSIDSIASEEIVTEYVTKDRDTVNYWLNVPSERLGDTLRGRVVYMKHDSVNNLVPDTAKLELFWKYFESNEEKKAREEEEKKMEKALKDSVEYIPPVKPNPFKVDLFKGDLNPEKSITLKFAMPLTQIDTAAIELLMAGAVNEKADEEAKNKPKPKNQQERDAAAEAEAAAEAAMPKVEYRLEQDTTDMKMWHLRAEWKPATKYKLMIPAGVFHNVAGQQNDTLKNEFKTLNPEEFGSVIVNVAGKTPNDTYVLYLKDSNGKVIDEIRGAKSGPHRFNYVKPGDVRVGVLEDKNNNGVWDTGNLIERRQPERTEPYVDEKGEEIMSVKANWEVEINANMNTIFAPITFESVNEQLRKTEAARLKSYGTPPSAVYHDTTGWA